MTGWKVKQQIVHGLNPEAAEQILEQQGLGDAAIAQAAEAAAKAVEPLSDRNGSAAYRRQLTQVLTERAIQAVRLLREHGVIFTVTSGRPPRAVTGWPGSGWIPRAAGMSRSG